jgi:hypothetical protein
MVLQIGIAGLRAQFEPKAHSSVLENWLKVLCSDITQDLGL